MDNSFMLAQRRVRFAAAAAMLAVAGVMCAPLRATPAVQENSAKRAYALQYLVATHADQKLKEGIDAFVPSLVRSLQQTHPTITPAQVEKFRQSIHARLMANMTAIRDLQVRLLTRTFSAKELQEAAAYQSSPTGQHFQAVSVELMTQIAGRRQELFSEAYKAAMKDAAAVKGSGAKGLEPATHK